MNMWEAIVLIVVISAIARTVRAAIMARAGGAGRHITFDRKGNAIALQTVGEAQEPKAESLRNEVEALRERIKVLERIATEDRKARDLADEIESLRR